MDGKPQLWLLAGGNGAGKSTYYKTYLAPLGMPMLNADELARVLYPRAPEDNSYIAARLIESMRETMLLEGFNFCFETVFSHHSKIDFLAKAKSLGYEIILVYIHLANSQLNIARVWQRVSEGGHNVPAEKVIERIKRLVPNIKIAIPLCDQVRLYDNSSLETPHRLVQVIKNGEVVFREGSPPVWLSFFD